MSASPKRRRGRPAIPRDVQRGRLVEGAWRAFERRNYDRTTVADIVAAAGMSSRSFYEHFASKEDLVAEMVESVCARLLAEVERILGELPATAEAVPDHADRSLVVLMELLPAFAFDLERIGGDAGLRVSEVRRRVVQQLVELTHDYMRRLHGRGLAPRVPDRAEVELLLTGIEGMSLRYCGEGRRAELLALRPRLLRLLLVGLG
jgi:AcrR family transcriptional regulator